VNPTDGRQELVSIDVLNAGWSVPCFLLGSFFLVKGYSLLFIVIRKATNYQEGCGNTYMCFHCTQRVVDVDTCSSTKYKLLFYVPRSEDCGL